MKINEEELRDVLKVEVSNAHQFSWNGWRIPIYVNEDETISSGNWLSNNSWQPDLYELPIKIKTWSMSDYGYDGEYNNNIDPGEDNSDYDDFDFDEVVNERVDFLINQLKNEIEFIMDESIEIL